MSSAGNGKDRRAPQLRLVGDSVGPPPQDSSIADIEWSILMSRSQDGNAIAYRQLLAAISPYVRALARRAHRDLSDVEDTVQDILTTAHLLRSTYDPHRPFGPWLKAIATRRIADSLRRAGRKHRREAVFTENLLEVAAPDGESETLSAHSSVSLSGLLSQLSPGEAEALKLTKIEGLSLAEASERSGHSITALKAAVHRAVGKLKKLLIGSQE